jgi:uncharacterized membrane protein YfcA
MLLVALGACVGFLSGLLGIGGGVILMPALVALNYAPLNAVGTSAVAVTLIALCGSIVNIRKYSFDIKDLSLMALPCIIVSQLGVYLATHIPGALLLILFGFLLLIILGLLIFKNSIQTTKKPKKSGLLLVGTIAGFLAGFFGIGGGVILVPLQVLFLGFELKVAIRSSLIVILLASSLAIMGHYMAGSIIFKDSIVIGCAGACGVQLGAYLMPRCSERLLRSLFTMMLMVLTLYVFWKAYVFIFIS